VDNVEPFTAIAEVKVYVDTTIFDFSAPSAPVNLMADGANPSPWQRDPIFSISWINPTDPSGIRRSLYKLGTAPTANDDTTGSASAVSPIEVRVTHEDGQNLYLWLEDGQGNVDYQNWADVILRYDSTSPVIDSLVALFPDFPPNWYNQDSTDVVKIVVYYNEAHAAGASLLTEGLSEPDELVNIPSGLNQYLEFSVNISDDTDAYYELVAIISDSADNVCRDSTLIRLDHTPPVGATAFSPDTSAELSFLVSWEGNASDSSGSGLSGRYDVRVSIDGGEWTDWLVAYHGESKEYIGDHGHSYAFEVVARDNVGNVEGFTGNPETYTVIDTTFNDVIAPQMPVELIAGGSNPSPWQRDSIFSISWINPPDPSGIRRSLYKLGTAPTANDDTTGTASAVSPIEVEATQEDGQNLYLWLKDSRGNVDYRNWADVTLRYDDTSPVIESLVALAPDFAPNWYNQDSTWVVKIKMYYNEAHAAGASLSTEGLGDPDELIDIPSGVNQTLEFSLNIADDPDGNYGPVAMISDSADNICKDSTLVRLDHTPPVGATAFSPDTSMELSFQVSWEGTASDSGGSGLSGRYDVRVRIDGGEWTDWLVAYHAESTEYIGDHGHIYSFEVVARDNVGNVEIFTGSPETFTVIDTTFSDVTAPHVPVELVASGSNPSPWQRDSIFSISWTNPPDPSGIRKSLYKLGTAPTGSDDTTATASAVSPIEVKATQEDGQNLYLWLKDSRGNVDYRNWANVTLRYDDTSPVIDSLVSLSPNYPPNWYNQDSTDVVKIKMYYDEAHAAEASLSTDRLGDTEVLVDILSGVNQTIEFSVNIAGHLDGNYQLKATLNDSAGNQGIFPPLGIKLDATPPVISHIPEFLANEGQGVIIEAIFKDNNRINETKIFYRMGGQNTYSSTLMISQDDTTFQATITGDEVTNRGVDYFLMIGDGLSISHSPSLNWVIYPHHIQVRIIGENNQGLVSDSPQPYGSEQKAFRMISLPIIVDDPKSDAVLVDDLGAYDIKKWRFFHYNTQSNTYDEFPDNDDLSPGKAFWLIVKDSNKTIDSGIGTSVPADSPFVIPIQRGWNDIGNPFNFIIDWDNISVSTGNIQNIMGPYTYENRWLLPSEINRIVPWKGYAIYTNQNDLSLIIPPIESSQGLDKFSQKLFSYVQWKLFLEAICQQAQDVANIIGCSEDALEEWDRNDYLEPPPIGSYVSLFFPHDDWEIFPGCYTTDFKPDFSRGGIWNFKIKTNIENSDVILEIKNSQDLTSRFEVILFDISNFQKINMRETNFYSYKSSQGKNDRSFKIVIGIPEFVREIESEIPAGPTNYHLAQNYPNPFNLETQIQYQLPQRIFVTLKIFNLLGQKIQTLVTEEQEIGYYKIQWDGSDDNNRVVGTGIYVLRMKAGDFVQVKKIILIK